MVKYLNLFMLALDFINLLTYLYFIFIDSEEEVNSEAGSKLPLLQSATALAISFAICKVGSFVTKYFAIQGGILPAVTAIVVVLATAFPKQFTHLAPAGEVMALILMQVKRPTSY